MGETMNHRRKRRSVACLLSFCVPSLFACAWAQSPLQFIVGPEGDVSGAVVPLGIGGPVGSGAGSVVGSSEVFSVDKDKDATSSGDALSLSQPRNMTVTSTNMTIIGTAVEPSLNFILF